eukprot:1181335-Prymnesium_polylepis.2
MTGVSLRSEGIARHGASARRHHGVHGHMASVNRVTRDSGCPHLQWRLQSISMRHVFSRSRGAPLERGGARVEGAGATRIGNRGGRAYKPLAGGRFASSAPPMGRACPFPRCCLRGMSSNFRFGKSGLASSRNTNRV